eukprot:CAMPEP_0204184832 /NCGR_PEP_ID=MMETSP0361-20130328/54762_1 /ASSEMBLY_ACC=CAM_ASM_000343 /TAXON_ID=268821 /ORGANISM="Scrippsiella Hangoei, Strain SHTV-5" /LENGTH=194 /DNA_ID=CAMNT_0051144921 /DNA_START=14 /DNA_END=595 /DNA_ORIENTATION=-
MSESRAQPLPQAEDLPYELHVVSFLPYDLCLDARVSSRAWRRHIEAQLVRIDVLREVLYEMSELHGLEWCHASPDDEDEVAQELLRQHFHWGSAEHLVPLERLSGARLQAVHRLSDGRVPQHISWNILSTESEVDALLRKEWQTLQLIEGLHKVPVMEDCITRCWIVFRLVLRGLVAKYSFSALYMEYDAPVAG